MDRITMPANQTLPDFNQIPTNTISTAGIKNNKGKGFAILIITIIIALFVGAAYYFWSLTGQEGIKKIATLPDNAVEFYAGPYLKSFAYKIKITRSTPSDKSNLDTNIQVGLSGIRVSAELYYDGNKKSYAGVCRSTNPAYTYKNIAIEKILEEFSGLVVCKDSQTAWAMSAQMNANPSQYMCSDSTGALTIRNSPITTTDCKASPGPKTSLEEGFAIVYNGEVGKTYGSIESFTFSPDGENFAYIAKEYAVDNQEFVVINGKEGKRYNKINELEADANGNFSYYVGGDDKYSNKIQVINENESHSDPSFFNYTKSPDGKSFAYQIREKDKRHVVYVDKNGIEHRGKDYLDSISFTWSPSGDHFFYIVHSGENGNTYIVVDGVEQGHYENVYRYLFKWNSNENGFAYRLDSDKAGRIVVLNGKEVGRFGESDGVSDLVVSPDGEAVVYSVHKQNERGLNVFVNEVKSPLQYDNFSGFVYSPDSKTLAYAIQQGGSVGIRKGNEELGRYQTQTRVDYSDKFPILFSRDWKNFAYPIVRVSTTTKQALIGGIATTSVVALQDFTVSINGQEGDTYGVVYLTKNSFSEDGKTFTYLAISRKNEIFRVINHVGPQ